MYGLWLNKKAAQKHGSNVKTKKKLPQELNRMGNPIVNK